MKKKLPIAILLVAGIIMVIWFRTPIDMMNIDPNEVMEISIFDGNTRNSMKTFDKEDITYVIENLNKIKLRREKLSLGDAEYSFKVTIYGNDGEEIAGWNNFIIMSKDKIQKSPFFYKVVEGSVDFQYIRNLIEESKSITDTNYDKIAKYMKEKSIETFSPYYELLDFQISNYVENNTDAGLEATFDYKIIEKNYDKDPDTVGYIKEAKDSGNINYQQMYDEYLQPREMNFHFKILIDKDNNITLYSNISPNGVEWEEIEMSDFIIKQ